MVTKERLIKIPVPPFNLVTTSILDFDSFCLSYQYDIDENGFGPYGFNTNKAESFLRLMFPEVYYFDEMRDILIKKEKINDYGLYFFDKYEFVKSENEKYRLLIKKNEILSRKGIEIKNIESSPLLWDINKDDKIKSEVIYELNKLDCGFFIVNNYIPEAGKSLIFANEKSLIKIKKVAGILEIDFNDFDSINELKPW